MASNMSTPHMDESELDQRERAYERALNSDTDIQPNEDQQAAIRGLTTILSKRIHSQPGDYVRTHNRIARLVQHVRNWGEDDPYMIDTLAKAMLCISDEKNAITAFFHSLVYASDGSADFTGINCDGCNRAITITLGRYVCRRCEDVDLCDRCCSDHANNNPPLSKCHGHEFYNVRDEILVELESPEAEELDVYLWFTRLQQQYSIKESILCDLCRQWTGTFERRQDLALGRRWSIIRANRYQCSLCRLVYEAYEMDAAYTEAVARNFPVERWQLEMTIRGRLPRDSEKVLMKRLSPFDTDFAEHVTEGFSEARWECATWLSIGPWTETSVARCVPPADRIKRLMLQPVAPDSRGLSIPFEGRLLGFPCVDFELIKYWLDRCDEHHPRCRRDPGDDAPDLILVDVVARVAAVVTEGSTPYVAISYRCGAGVLEPVRPDGQLPSAVPNTIEDAMAVTRHLGFKYLWVDCYCVPQNDPGRRRVALDNMYKIYRGSSLTIVAPYGTADTGLPGIRPDTRPVNNFSGEWNGRTWMSVPADDAFEQAWNGWRTRAWTYQEAILSRRNLYFGLTKMYFDCRTEGFTEFLGEPWTIDPSSGERCIQIMRYRHGLVEYQLPPMDGALRMSFRTYRDLLLEYSRRNITNLSDRLDAILGVMNSLSTTGSITFHFGLLESEFVRSLFWIPLAKRGRSYAMNRDNCQFPSWSWAGSEGPSQPTGTEWEFVGVHISKRAKTGEVIRICSSSSTTATPPVLADQPRQRSGQIQNDSVRFYDPMIIVEASVCDAVLTSTNTIEVVDSSADLITRGLTYSWHPSANVSSQSEWPVLLLVAIAAGSVLCLERLGTASNKYVALGWAYFPSEVWDQIPHRQEEVEIY